MAAGTSSLSLGLKLRANLVALPSQVSARTSSFSGLRLVSTPASASASFSSRKVLAMGGEGSGETPSTSDAATTVVADQPAAASEKLSEPTITAPPNFQAPEPKRFAARSDQILALAATGIPSLLRLGTGAFVAGYNASFQGETAREGDSEDSYAVGPVLGYNLVEKQLPSLRRAEQPIILYEFESCPFCRKVREMVSYLALDVLFYPTPRDGPNFRPRAIAEGGKKQFPYMIDPNTGVKMYESDDIIKYLANTYGDGSVPLTLRLGPITAITAGLAGIGRISRGGRYVPAKQPPLPLELWAYEVSPFCKLVREVLVELELPHIQHSCPRGSAKRDELLKRTGRFQVPYLEDPNTGVKMFESAAIVDYLNATYALSPPTHQRA